MKPTIFSVAFSIFTTICAPFILIFIMINADAGGGIPTDMLSFALTLGSAVETILYFILNNITYVVTIIAVIFIASYFFSSYVLSSISSRAKITIAVILFILSILNLGILYLTYLGEKDRIEQQVISFKQATGKNPEDVFVDFNKNMLGEVKYYASGTEYTYGGLPQFIPQIPATYTVRILEEKSENDAKNDLQLFTGDYKPSSSFNCSLEHVNGYWVIAKSSSFRDKDYFWVSNNFYISYLSLSPKTDIYINKYLEKYPSTLPENYCIVKNSTH